MSGPLAELWGWGFQLGGRRHAWGTLPRELAETELRGGEEHGLPTIHRLASAPHPDRPVMNVQFQIAAEARLFEDRPLAELRARLDADLGPGEHVDAEHGPEKTNSRWRLDGADVWLTAYPSDWGFNWGRSSGRLMVNVHRERVAEPYLSTFRAGAGVPAGELQLVPAPGLRDTSEPPWDRDELSLALSRPDLCATPEWVTARLRRERVGVWSSGDTRGISVPLFTLRFPAAGPPALRHIRWAAARGSGYATLDAGRDRDLLVSYPGPDGLDAVAARLAALGVPVARQEEQDWG